MDCQFEIGDKVTTPAGEGVVIDKIEAGNSFMLKVDLDNGGVITIDCRQAR